MLQEKDLIKTFQLNYGAWQLLDNEFLELYRHLFLFDSDRRPLFELSPEIFNDQARKKIKNQNIVYSIQELKDNTSLVHWSLENNVKVSIFFSRYHDVLKTYPEMKKEIAGIFRLQHELFIHNMPNARVHYDHLSTDIASLYWETYVDNPKDFDTLLSSVRRIRAQETHSFPVNNFFIYIPETLSEEDVFRCELLIEIFKMLGNNFHEMFHITIHCLGSFNHPHGPNHRTRHSKRADRKILDGAGRLHSIVGFGREQPTPPSYLVQSEWRLTACSDLVSYTMLHLLDVGNSYDS